MRLFEVPKIGCYLDALTHATEVRSGDATKIVVLTLRCEPFDHVLATALHQDVRRTLFKLNHPDACQYLSRVDFRLGVPRQQLIVYAAPDVKRPAIVFDQARIISTSARTQKDATGFAFVWKASFGPVGKLELEYLQDWLLGQRFVTTEAAEPGLFPDDDQDDDFEPEPSARPTPMFDDDEVPTP